MHVPDLSSICESESHVVLLFDQTPNSFCYLGLGSKRELRFEKPEPGILEALEAFSQRGSSWTFGWLGYDLKNTIENLETHKPNTLGHPVLAWWEPEILIRFSDVSIDILRGNKSDPRTTEAVEAIKRSVKNLLNTNHYEKPFHPEIGSNLRAMLFELMTPQMNHVISKQIENLINNYEPRCRLVQVHTQPMFERNAYAVQISFYVQNYPDPVVVESFLERLR